MISFEDKFACKTNFNKVWLHNSFSADVACQKQLEKGEIRIELHIYLSIFELDSLKRFETF